MQIRVSTRHTDVAKGDKDLIVEKLTRLGSKYLEMDSAEVHFSQERNPRIQDKEVCEVTLNGQGHHVRCTANGPDPLTAVDRAIDKLENKLHKLKTKLSTHRTHRDVTKAKMWARARSDADDLAAVLLEESAAAVDGAIAVDDTDTDADTAPVGAFEFPVTTTADDVAQASDEAVALVASYRIVKMKRVERETLTPLDAAMRMDLVEHAFFFFTSIETGRAAVVYRRADGDIGLIDQD